MGLVADIAESWRAPRRVVRRHLDSGAGEGRPLMMLMLASALGFVAQLPRLAREAHLDPQVPFEARLAGAFFGLVCLAPLAFYGLAALSRIAARAFGLGLTWYGARVALFWALLASSPLALLHGLAVGLSGGGMLAPAIWLIHLGIFLYLWFAGMAEAGRDPGPAPQAEPARAGAGEQA